MYSRLFKDKKPATPRDLGIFLLCECAVQDFPAHLRGKTVVSKDGLIKGVAMDPSSIRKLQSQPHLGRSSICTCCLRLCNAAQSFQRLMDDSVLCLSLCR
jgi:hypothetical protein